MEILKKKKEEIFELIDGITNLAIERNSEFPVISFSIKGKSDTYSCFISKDEKACSCVGQTVHKSWCKHLVSGVYYCYLTNSISKEEFEKILGGG